MTGQVDTYRKEIFNFLRTVTIKFEPFAYSMGQSYMDTYGISDPNGKWNPYYIHLAGEYTADELKNNPMTVWAIENDKLEKVIFSKDLVKTNPKTASVYRIPNDEYIHLEEKYPAYRGLIRCMVYPVKDIQTAIDAPNLSLLAYDENLLEINERESLLTCLRDYLKMVKERWWVPEYAYEDMYAITFWTMLWQTLPEVLLCQRFRNIRTPAVHSFHVWEYLISNNIGDYRDVLTSNQALWLYRNLEYIKKNKGKNSNLKILAENLLGEACVSLLYKDMYQDTTNFEENLYTKPDFISRNLLTNKLEKIEQFDDLNPRLVKQKLEPNSSLEYQLSTEVSLGTQNYNILPTKYLELKKNPIDTSNEGEIVNFYLQSLLYKVSKNRLSYNVSVTDPLNGVKLKLYITDMILLWYYSTMRSVGENPTYIPAKARIYEAFVEERPESKKLRQYTYYSGNKYYIKSLVAVERLLAAIPWETTSYINRDSFMKWLSAQWQIKYILKRDCENSNKYLYHKALMAILNDITIHKLVDLNLSKYTYFSDWLNDKDNAAINTVIKAYDNYSYTEQLGFFKQLTINCYDTLFDTADSASGTNTVRKLNRIYNAVRDLFISLCSYNITFLESDRDTRDYLKIVDPDFITDITARNYSEDLLSFVVCLADHFRWNWKNTVTMRLNDVEVYNYVNALVSSKTNMFFTIPVDYGTDIKMKICGTPFCSQISYTFDKVQRKTKNRFILHTGVDNYACTKMRNK